MAVPGTIDDWELEEQNKPLDSFLTPPPPTPLPELSSALNSPGFGDYFTRSAKTVLILTSMMFIPWFRYHLNLFLSPRYAYEDTSAKQILQLQGFLIKLSGAISNLRYSP